MVAIPTVILIRLLTPHIYSPSHPVGMLAAAALAAAVLVLYYGLLEGVWGAAAGKAVFGLRVTDAAGVAPGIRRGVRRAVAFALPAQLVLLIVRMMVLHRWPEFSVRVLDSCGSALYLAMLFSTARRANGFQALHDQRSRTRVVRRRVRAEARRRADRAPRQEQAPFAGGARIGPYLVPADSVTPVSEPVVLDGFDDRLHRPVWLEHLPPDSPALPAARRDLGRPARVRWLGGRRQGSECWDAYEAVDGVPVDDVAAAAQPWSRVRHWLDDLARELAEGLADGSLPPLGGDSIWIGADDRLRVLEWHRAAGALSRISGEPPDAAAAQRVLYAVAVALLLGIPVADASARQPDMPRSASRARPADEAPRRKIRVRRGHARRRRGGAGRCRPNIRARAAAVRSG